MLCLILTYHPVHLLHIVPIQPMFTPPPEACSGHEGDVHVQEGYEQHEGVVLVPGGVTSEAMVGVKC